MTASLDAPADSDVGNLALDNINVSDPQLYQNDVWYPYFARLRREDPVHYCRQSQYGPYWSVTKYKDIMQVEINHQVYSSDGAIQILDPPKGLEMQSFIAMDPSRQHLSFGFGIHHCVGNRLAELQLRILWEEIMQRYPVIEVTGPARRVYSNFIHGIRSLPARIPA